MRKILAAVGIIGICALIACICYFAITRTTSTPSVPPTPLSSSTLTDFGGYTSALIHIDGQAIRVAIADTPTLQSLGLGNRGGLPDGEGMLFVFDADKKHAFWMKDMRFSIDMVWISRDGVIVYMAQNVSPKTYPEDFVPTSPARYVLELPAGYVTAHNIKVGDIVSL